MTDLNFAHIFLTFLIGFLTGGAVMRNIHRGEWKDEDQ